MKLFGRGAGAWGDRTLGFALAFGLGAVVGCASPGPPRAPSLRLPEPVSDLSARRVGDAVELRFTAPWRSTDKLPLRGGTVNGVLCRALEGQSCVAVAGFAGRTAIATAGPNGGRNAVTWRDALPPELATGAARLLSYRVEFFSDQGRSAGKSDAAYTAAGRAPAAVEGLQAEGSRLGVILRWQKAAEGQGNVLLEREDLAGQGVGTKGMGTKGAATNIVWLESNASGQAAGGAAGGEAGISGGAGNLDEAGNSDGVGTVGSAAARTLDTTAAQTLDTTAAPGAPYRYTAWRSLTVRLGGRPVEMRSAASAAVEWTLRENYPPPPPTGLSAAGFFAARDEAAGAGAGYAVDLIWQPVDEAGLIAGFAGYNIYRARLAGGLAAGLPAGTGADGGGRTRLNAGPVVLPAFRDNSADPAVAYQYFVTAVDGKGNESGAATVDVLAAPGARTR